MNSTAPYEYYCPVCHTLLHGEQAREDTDYQGFIDFYTCANCGGKEVIDIDEMEVNDVLEMYDDLTDKIFKLENKVKELKAKIKELEK